LSAPLEGVKILDFTHLLPGPYATMVLADLGAQIIKVENPSSPDMMRFMPPIVNGMSAVYSHVNRGKKSLALDLKKKSSKEIILKLVQEYDIVIEQFRPGVMKKFGLTYDDLKAVNESIIYCSLTGYGQRGSFADRAGHDINYMALSGIDSFSGRKETGPALSGIQIADIAGGGKNAVIGILAAYIKRGNTGRGDYIDISITDSAFSLSVFTTAAFLEDGIDPLPESGPLNGGAIYDYYRTADNRYLSVGPLEPKFLVAFCDIIGYTDLIQHLTENPDNAVTIKKNVSSIIGTKPLQYWIERFKETDACVEPVVTLSEAVTQPPLSERNMVVTIPDSHGRLFSQTGNPIKFSSGDFFSGVTAAPLGADNNEILETLGFTEEEANALETGAD
jgi:alpha-methylacyl-CoA racemase